MQSKPLPAAIRQLRDCGVVGAKVANGIPAHMKAAGDLIAVRVRPFRGEPWYVFRLNEQGRKVAGMA